MKPSALVALGFSSFQPKKQKKSRGGIAHEKNS